MRKALKSSKPLRGASDPRHGTSSGYGYWGCRCGKCRTAATEKTRRSRESATVANHGRYGYDMGCRCEDCKTGKSAQMAESYARRRDWRKANRLGDTAPTDMAKLA